MASSQGTVKGMKETLKPLRDRPAGRAASSFVHKLKELK